MLTCPYKGGALLPKGSRAAGGRPAAPGRLGLVGSRPQLDGEVPVTLRLGAVSQIANSGDEVEHGCPPGSIGDAARRVYPRTPESIRKDFETLAQLVQ
jgi:hypothetical protein